jgi:hypothetical protein
VFVLSKVEQAVDVLTNIHSRHLDSFNQEVIDFLAGWDYILQALSVAAIY